MNNTLQCDGLVYVFVILALVTSSGLNPNPITCSYANSGYKEEFRVRLGLWVRDSACFVQWLHSLVLRAKSRSVSCKL